MKTMNLLSLAILCSCSLAACAVDVQDGPVESTDSSALTANEVDKTYFSDATFSKVVGTSDLFCSGGKRVTGTTSHYYATDTFPCNSGGETLTCYELAPVGSDLVQVPCPPYVQTIITDL